MHTITGPSFKIKTFYCRLQVWHEQQDFSEILGVCAGKKTSGAHRILWLLVSMVALVIEVTGHCLI